MNTKPPQHMAAISLVNGVKLHMPGVTDFQLLANDVMLATESGFAIVPRQNLAVIHCERLPEPAAQESPQLSIVTADGEQLPAS